jgi:hypothetical protein
MGIKEGTLRKYKLKGEYKKLFARLAEGETLAAGKCQAI